MWAARQLQRRQAGVMIAVIRSVSGRTEGEQRIAQVLKDRFPRAAHIRVVDISGGCGSMYDVHVKCEDFREKRIVQQHHLINEALRDEIKSMHGLRIFTSVPSQ